MRSPPRYACLEDDPQFNAGRGAVLNHDGDAELDAAIMDGHGPHAGAVAAVRHVKNPIELARLVMETARTCCWSARAPRSSRSSRAWCWCRAATFARAHAISQLEEARQAEKERGTAESGHGTVGAVARDRAGNLAAATSTGGLTNKHARPRRRLAAHRRGHLRATTTVLCGVRHRPGRVLHPRSGVAYDMCALLEYQPPDAGRGGHEEVIRKLQRSGGQGGSLRSTAPATSRCDFNTPGMFRGVRDSHGRRETAMYQGEHP